MLQYLAVAIATAATTFLVRKRRYRWIYIIAKTFRRDMTAVHRFIIAGSYLFYWYRKELTVPKNFTAVVKKYPNRIAYYFEDERWTFQQLEDLSNRIAHYFKKQGYKRGETVALLLENRPDYVAIWLGLSKIGVVTALINTNLVSDPLIHCITIAQSKAMIYGSDYAKVVESVQDRLGGIPLYEFKTSDVDVQNGATDLKTELQNCSTESPTDDIEQSQQQDRLVFIYTSGTTGLPKAAKITNFRYMYGTLGPYALANLTQNDVYYAPLPLYHSAGGQLGAGQAVVFGISVALRKKFSASNYWSDCKKYNCTVAAYIGELCRFLLAAHKPENSVDHKVTKVIGNGLKPEIWDKFVETFKIKQVYEFYGSTEGNVNIANMDNKKGAVGFIPRHLSFLYPARIVKCDESGQPVRDSNGFCTVCEPGEGGLLIGKIRKNLRFSHFTGYASESDNKRKILRDVFTKGDTYFNTGDIMVQDEFGYFYFQDRTGDTFRWKGENVSTNEVETVISKIVGLKETVVYGVQVPGTDGKAGMAAIVDPKNQVDVDSLGKSLKSNLPGYAIPLFLRVLDSVPLTSTFKVKKMELRKEGFDVNNIKDKMYFYDAKNSQYIPFTKELCDSIVNERIRV